MTKCIIKGCNIKPEEMMVHHCGKEPDECDVFEEDEEHCFFEVCLYHLDQLHKGEVTPKDYRKQKQ